MEYARDKKGKVRPKQSKRVSKEDGTSPGCPENAEFTWEANVSKQLPQPVVKHSKSGEHVVKSTKRKDQTWHENAFEAVAMQQGSAVLQGPHPVTLQLLHGTGEYTLGSPQQQPDTTGDSGCSAQTASKKEVDKIVILEVALAVTILLLIATLVTLTTIIMIPKTTKVKKEPCVSVLYNSTLRMKNLTYTANLQSASTREYEALSRWFCKDLLSGVQKYTEPTSCSQPSAPCSVKGFNEGSVKVTFEFSEVVNENAVSSDEEMSRQMKDKMTQVITDAKQGNDSENIFINDPESESMELTIAEKVSLIECDPVRIPMHSSLVNGIPYPMFSGENVTLRCDYRYKFPDGSRQRTISCMENGEHSQDVGICEDAGFGNQFVRYPACMIVDPVDGKWGSWSNWSSSSGDCETKNVTRERHCNKPKPAHGGLPCEGINIEEMIVKCTVGGKWGLWSAWTSRYGNCETKIITRDRNCNIPREGGLPCEGSSSESQIVNCSADGNWGLWSLWTTSYGNCDTMNITRERHCDSPIPRGEGLQCEGNDTETQLVNCTVDGNWSSWKAWTSSIGDNKTTIITRGRQCDNPLPSGGGLPCDGNSTEIEVINSPWTGVNIDGNWGPWNEWTSNHGDCETMDITRVRHCDNPTPIGSGLPCEGNDTETQLVNCVVDGNWGPWNPWTSSIGDNGTTIITRARHCDNPLPAGGGLPCEGNNTEIDVISTPWTGFNVNGIWGPWNEWTSSHGDCETINITRERHCDNPKPIGGGLPCEGNGTETQLVNCIVDGNWGPWNPWNSSIGDNETIIITRERHCDNPLPAGGGLPCEGNNTEIYVINTPWTGVNVDGNWGPWNEWPSTHGDCETMNITRVRLCDNPRPIGSGLPCEGNDTETQLVNCIVDGNWGPWNAWTSSIGDNVTTIITRERQCDNPLPAGGGLPCEGNSTESDTILCQCTSVKIDGNWGSWKEWASSYGDCETMNVTRERLCDNPRPTGGGLPCEGIHFETQVVNCTVHGNWGAWNTWTLTWGINGIGLITRERNCSSPKPGVEDFECEGNSLESQPIGLTYSASCGGRVYGSYGIISSPNYPMNYQNDLSCVWIIEVAEGKAVQLEFDDFMIEYDIDCDYDSVSVYDNAGLRFGPFCDDLPKRIVSKSNQLIIELITDNFVTAKGFQARYSTIEPMIVNCGNIRNDSDGVIASPKYPNNYDNNLHCIWTIAVAQGKRVQLEFEELYVEDQHLCGYDSLSVYDNTGLRFGPFCNEYQPKIIVSKTNHLVIDFITDTKTTEKGFQAKYSAIDPMKLISCGSLLNSSDGILTSPNYPNHYDNFLHCIWNIQVSEGKIIQLEFSDLDLEYHPVCGYDSVSVYDSDDFRFGTFCDQNFDPIIVSKSNNLTIIFTSDSSETDSGFEARYTEIDQYINSCGGQMMDPDASFASPGYPTFYENNLNCLWTIQVREGKVIRLEFENFYLNVYSTCDEDRLYISNYDGFKFGPFCDDYPPKTIVSNSNTLIIELITDNRYRNRGFKASYTEIDPLVDNCTTFLSGPNGILASPNYPDDYGNFLQCTWTIEVTAGKIIQLEFFEDFYLEDHPACSYDSVSVYDSDDTRFGPFCEYNEPPIIVSKSNNLTVLFISDSKWTDSGFIARYTEIDSYSDTCGGQMSDPKGIFASPGYPNFYENNLYCIWKIQAQEGKVIQLQFEDFDFEDSLCDEGRLYISNYDGFKFGPFCEDYPPKTIISNSNTLIIELITENRYRNKGFKASYTEIDPLVDNCTTFLSGPNGIVASPNYPNNYNNFLQCTWTIEVMAGKVVQLEFDDFMIEYDSDCDYDSVFVYDNAGLRFGPFCDDLPKRIVSISNQLIIEFITDDTVTEKGFQARYSTIEPLIANCGDMTNDTDGVIESPNYPNNYGNNLHCIWTIEVAQGKVVQLEFEDFNVEDQTTCGYDSLSVYDNSGLRSGPFCNEYRPKTIVSKSNHLVIEFITDGTGTEKGFQAKYSAKDPMELISCGSLLNSSDGILTSPNYPNLYDNFLLCIWNIQVSEGKIIQLEFSNLDVEYHPACSYDSVFVYDSDDTRLGPFCGYYEPPIVVSKSNNLTILFISDISGTDLGFEARYTEIDEFIDSCGGQMIDPDGSFASPGYPNFYKNNLNCLWKIQVREGKIIQLEFVGDFYLEYNPACSYDSVSVYDSDDTRLGPFCEYNKPPIIVSKSNTLTILFISDSSWTDWGFKARYTEIDSYSDNCGGQMSDPKGIFTSPGYPNIYENNLYCIWNIQAGEGKVIQLEFEDFDLDGDSYCNEDRLYISNYDGHMLGPFCDNYPPKTIVSNSNTLIIELITDNSFRAKGFKASYTEIEPLVANCTTFLNGPNGTLASPNYPNNNFLQCTWTIEVEAGKVIQLEFEEFEMNNHPTCSYDRVSVIGLGDGNIRHFCGVDLPKLNVSISNNITVKLITDGGGTSLTGFKAMYTAVEPFSVNCGSALNGSDGIITSPNYPSNYDNYHNCSWSIEVTEEKVIQLEFEDIDIEYAYPSNCIYDGVSVFGLSDGNSGPFCSSLPKITVSNSNKITVTFITDGTVTKRGFKAKYIAVDPFSANCGSTLNGLDGIVTSPHYPNNYDNFLNCSWTIEVAEGKVIQLEFEDIDMEYRHSNSCMYDSVSVYGLSDGNSGPFCSSLPKITVSNSNKIIVTFTSDSSVTKRGFKAKFNAVEPFSANCGAYLNTSEGTFSSPGYPSNYDNYLNCSWTIEVPQGNIMWLKFEYFDVESVGSCRYDSLSIYDHGGPSFGPYCNYDPPDQVIVSKANRLTIQFNTDSSITGTGFQGRYMKLPSIQKYSCGDIWGISEGTLASPNYPFFYDEYLNQNWVIHGAEGKVIQLEFEDFRVRPDYSCRDSVSVYDQDNVYLDNFCGYVPPGIIVSNSTKLTIEFVTGNNSDRDRGFLAKYTTFVPVTGKPCNCLDLLNNGTTESGVYTIYVQTENNPYINKPIQVYCDMETDGGGWLVFQRKIDGSEDFKRGWFDYKNGFGGMTSEFWLGNENLYQILNTCGNEHHLRVDLEDFSGNTTYASYSTFNIADEDDLYYLYIEGYTGDAGDLIGINNNWEYFSTVDLNVAGCSELSTGGWWSWGDCSKANLNALYMNGNYTSNDIYWYDSNEEPYPLKGTEMKIRPKV